MDSNVILAALSFAGIPCATTGLCFWWLQKKMEKREAQRDERDKARKENEFLVIQGVGAAIALGEATAHAIQTGTTNGEMTTALEYAKDVKHKQKEFLQKQGVQSIYQ